MSSSSNRPQSKYLCYLLDEFEKCTQQTNDLSNLQKDHAATKKDLAEALKEIRNLKFERQMQTEKVAALQRELQEQKLLHTQLRDEASSEFRGLYRKAGNHDKDIDLLKYQMRMNTKKFSLDMENLRWELTTNSNRRFDDSDLADFSGPNGNSMN